MKMNSLLCVVVFTSLTTMACSNGASFSAGSSVSSKDRAASENGNLGNGSTVPEQGDFGDDSIGNPGGSGTNPNGTGNNPTGGTSNGGSNPADGSNPDSADDSSSSDYPPSNPNNCVWDDVNSQCVPGTNIPGQSGSGYNPAQSGNQNQNKTGSN